MAAQVGPQLLPNGSLPQTTPRLDKTTAAVVTQAHGKYAEAVINQKVFSACEQGTGIAPGTALGTTAAFVLYNPATSGTRLILCKVYVGYISGTLGAGTLYHCIDKTTTQAAPSGGTALSVVCNDIGNGASSVAVPRVNGTVASTVVAYRPFITLNAMLATTATNPVDIGDDMDGELIIEPGCSYQLQAVAAAGTSPKLTFGAVWEEVPII